MPKKILVLSAILLLIATQTQAGANLQSPCQQKHCSLILDAGSSGTRAHLYAYDIDEEGHPRHPQELWSKKVKPGLSSMQADPQALKPYLETLFQGIPERNFDVRLFATGGMRMLSNEEQARLYKAVKTAFENQSGLRLVEAKTISGDDEALYGFLAVNEYLGRLDDAEKPLSSFMDFGGASVQIAFPVSRVSQASETAVKQLRVYGRDLRIFVKSFLGLGNNALSLQYRNQPVCFPSQYTLPDGNSGKGDLNLCRQAIDPLVTIIHKVNAEVVQELQQNLSTDWYAMGSFASLANNESLPVEKTKLSLQELSQQGGLQFCQSNWSQQLSASNYNEYCYLNCLTLAAINSLVTKGYGLRADQPIHFAPKEANLDWTAGAVLAALHPA